MSFLYLLWTSNLLIIFALSLKGRQLLTLTLELMPKAWIGYAVSTALLLAILAWIIKNKPFKKDAFTLLTCLFVLLALILIFGMENPVEKLHLLLFGVLGFLSLNIFGLRFGLVICLTMAGLDELVQYFHPDRVGGLKDVSVNSIASIIGLWLSFFQKFSEFKQLNS